MRKERELAEEIMFHLEERKRELMESGMNEKDATAQARREFGSSAMALEDARAEWPFGSAEELLLDLRYGFRVLRRNAGFSLLALAVMAFGIAAATVVFSVVNAALLKPLPYRDAGRLMIVWDQLRALRLLEFPTTMGTFDDYRERNHAFEKLEAFIPATATIQFTDRAERVPAMRVSSGLLPMVGAQAVLGRLFSPGEDRAGNDNTVLLSYGFWLRHFGGDPNALGKALSIDNRSYSIAGVLDPQFRFRLAAADAPELWIPIPFEPDQQRSRGALRMIARLKDGVSVDQARTDMRTVSTQLGAEHNLYRGPRGEDAGYTVAVVPLREQLFGGARNSLLLLLAATVAILAIACANVAHLFLEWRLKRAGEMAIRQSLGASRGRLLRQMMTESLLLTAAAGVLGLTAAYVSALALFRVLPRELSALDGVPLDWRVFVFAAAVCGLSGILFGSLRDKTMNTAGARVTGQTGRSILLAVQTCFSVVLLVMAGLLLHSLFRMQAVDPGFQQESILTAQLSLPSQKYREPHQLRDYWDRLQQWLSRQPEVGGVAVGSLPLLTGGAGGDPFSVEGRSFRSSGSTPQFAHYGLVTPSYFPLMRIPLIGGRQFTDSDRSEENPVALVNQTLAKGFWPNENPIGKRILIGAPRPGARWMTVIGVVGDVHSSGLQVKPLPQIYSPLALTPPANATLFLSTQASPDRLRSMMAAFDRETPLYAVSTVEERVRGSLQQPRFRTALFSGFGVAAFLLAALGIYSVTAFRVTRKHKEIGLRMAFGASAGEIRRWVTWTSLRPVIAGMTAGLLCAAAASRLLAGLLFEVSPADAASYLIACLLFIAVAVVASLPAAVRATRLDPSEALRSD